MRRLAQGTRQRQPGPVVVGVQAPGRQAAWALVSRRAHLTGSAITTAYGRRCTVEATLRDVPNARGGLGRTQGRLVRHDRRAARVLRAALAHTSLRRLGQAGQGLGMARRLGATRPQQRALFRQGLRLCARLPTMRADRLRALGQQCGARRQAQVLCTGLLGVL